MSVITSRLTEEDLKQVFELLGKVKLHLLYKASVHKFYVETFYDKCNTQGATLTIGYTKSGSIIGGYISKSFASYVNVKDNKAFLFRLANEAAKRKLAKFAVNPDSIAFTCSQKSGLSFGDSLVFLAENMARVKSMPHNSYVFEDDDPFGCNESVDLVECETYRVEELKAPLRKIDWSPRKRSELFDFINKKQDLNSKNHSIILLIGPLEAGKSSFINSVDSIFHGYVTNRALAGSVTTKFSKYIFPRARLTLCDTMGFAESKERGISNEDIMEIIKGNIPNCYKFNRDLPKKAAKETCSDLLVQCVAYVIDASKNPVLSSEMVTRMQAIHSQVNELGVQQIVLLTKVDKTCPVVAEDLENVFRSNLITRKMMEVGEQIGIPVTCILPVINYWLSHELDCATDILVLTALKHMLRYVDVYRENFKMTSEW